jgi:hypothetical protein
MNYKPDPQRRRFDLQDVPEDVTDYDSDTDDDDNIDPDELADRRFEESEEHED